VRPGQLALVPPPPADPGPYRIGVGDVLLLATPPGGGTVEQLSGLLAAESRRQGYTVQDDGSIAIPDIGRIPVAGLTLERAEDALFQALVAANVEPAFSLEVAEFRSQRVAVGGAVGSPTLVPMGLMDVTLNEALSAAGGVTANNPDFTLIRIYRDGQLFQIPLDDFLARPDLQGTVLLAGDSVFVGNEFDLDRAQSYFAEQIAIANFRDGQRSQALSELQAQIALRRAALEEERGLFTTRLGLDAVDRDYVYLTGEVASPSRFALPFERTASLADALFDSGGFNTAVANPAKIYVLRASDVPAEMGAVTAWQLDAGNAAMLTIAPRMELRPGDVIFIAQQPITTWNRTVSQLLPQILTVQGRLGGD
jgi:polysaccharide export outer membrane protein